MQQPEARRTLITHEFEQLPVYFYKDKQLLKQERLDELEQRLRTRHSRLTTFLAVAIILWLASVVWGLIDAARTSSTSGLVINVTAVGAVTAWGLYMAYQYGHTKAKLDTIRYVLDWETAPQAPAPPSDTSIPAQTSPNCHTSE